MAIFDSIKDTLNKSVATMSVKSESLVESSKVKASISETQRKVDGALAGLGPKFYQMVKDGQMTAGGLAEDVEELRKLEKELQELEARLEQIKEEEAKLLSSTGAKKPAAPAPAPAAAEPAAGGSFCSSCGKALAPDSRFCDECGTPVAKA